MSNVIVMGLSGPSCAGKTTIALCLVKLFPQTVVIHQDNFYKNNNQIPIDPETGLQDWDCPAAFDMEKLTATIRETRRRLENKDQLSESSATSDARNNSDSQWANPPENIDLMMDPNLLKDLQQLVTERLGTSAPKDIPFSIILVDGILIFHENPLLFENKEQEACHPGVMCDTGIFVYARYSKLKSRREARKGYATKDGIWTDPPGYFDSIVWPNFIKYHHQFVNQNGEIHSDAALTATTDRDACLRQRVVVCSSDSPIKETMKLCINALADEWDKRSK